MIKLGAIAAICCVATALSPAQPVKIPGATLVVSSWGKGEPVVALPGRGMDANWFAAVATRIADGGYRFIAINPRGIGGSTGSLEHIDINSLANDTVAAMDAMGLREVHVVGWALGNRVARVLAASHPQRVATITLLAAGGKFPSTQPSNELDQAMARWRSDPLRNDTHGRYLGLFSPRSNPWSLLRDAGVGAWPEAAAAQSAGGAPLERWWSGANKPMLVIQGLDDFIAPPANGRDLRREFPARVELLELEGAGHGLLLERPKEIADAVIRFLKAHGLKR